MRSSSDTRHWPEREGLDARMTTVAAAVAGATLVTGAMASDAQRSSANKAADAQSAASQAGIAQSNQQFEALQKILQPFVTTGTDALGGQRDLLGLNGTDAQQKAIDALQNSPQFAALARQGLPRHAPALADVPRGFDALIDYLFAHGNILTGPAIACAPVIDEVLAALRALPGMRLARMSGSGATCFALFSTPAEAEAAARSLAGRGWWVAATVLSGAP